VPPLSAGRFVALAGVLLIAAFPHGTAHAVAAGFNMPTPPWSEAGEELLDGIGRRATLAPESLRATPAFPRHEWDQEEEIGERLLIQPRSPKFWIGHPLSTTRRPQRGGDRFQYALGLYRFGKKEYQQAAEAFLEMLTRFGSSPLRVRALYWLAESQSGGGEWEAADKTYRILLREEPEERLRATVLTALGGIARRRGSPEDALGYYRQFLDNHPSAPSAGLVAFNMGEVFVQLGKHDAAAEQFRRVSREHRGFPDPGLAIFQWGEALRTGASLEAARKRYGEYLSRFPGGPYSDLALYGVGWCRLEEGSYREAGETFRELPGRYPESVLADECLLLAGWSYLRMGGHRESREALLTLIEEYDASPWAGRALFLLGLSYYETKEYDAALAHFQQAEEAEGGDLPRRRTTFMEALSLTMKGASGEALTIFEALLEESNTEEKKQILPWAGWAAFQAEEFSRAAEAFKSYSVMAPTRKSAAEAYFWLGVSRSRQGRHPKASLAFGKALETLPGGPREAGALFYLGENYFRQENWKEAGNKFRLIVESPETGYLEDALVLLGDSLVRQGKAREATQLYMHFLQGPSWSSEGGKARFRLGMTYLQMGDADGAEREFKTLLRTGPQSDFADDARFQLALGMYRAERFEDAARMFAELIRQSPGSELAPISQLRRADSLYRLRKLGEALDAYRKVLRVYPWSDYVPDAEYGISLLALARGDFEQFVGLSREFAGRYPGSTLTPRVLAQLGRQLLLNQSYEEAGEIFSWLMGSYPGEESSAPVVILAARADRGRESRMETAVGIRKDLAQADGLLEAERRFQLANLYLEEGNCEGALREYREIVRNSPEHPLTPYAVLDSAGCHLRGENPAEAMKAYRLLAERFGASPLLPGAQYQRGVLALEQGRYDEAEEALRRIGEDAGGELGAGAAFQLGKMFQRTERVPEAYEEYLRSMRIAPRGKFSLRAAFRAAGIARGMGLEGEAERLYRLVMAGEDEIIAKLAREELGEAGR